MARIITFEIKDIYNKIKVRRGEREEEEEEETKDDNQRIINL